MNPRIIFVAVLVAVIGLMAALSYRAFVVDNRAERLCNVLVRIVSDGDKALAGVSYYREHPDELAAAHARNHAVLDQLDCGGI